jgi:glycosyltransferase involved in cell wall biosynthesis
MASQHEAEPGRRGVLSDKVSIIVPTRNRRDWLRQALRSVREQTWPAKEMVVVDEASTDDTLAMVAAEFPEARVIKHATARGPSAARNAGIAAATGEWILFLDDDDVLHPEHLESLVKASKDAPKGAVVSGRWRRFTVVADKVRVGPIVCAPPDRRGLDTLAEILEPMGEGTICGHSLLWPSALLAKVPWDERLSANGDSDFFGRAILAGAQIVGRPVGMAYYRVHHGERVSSATALRRPLSAAQYRLKWSQLLLSHPEHEIFAPAMRNGFMALLIALSGLPEARGLVPILKDAYWLWGGEGYFVSNPPVNPLKRVLAAGVLWLGGPSGLHWLLKQASQPGRLRQSQLAIYYDPITDDDRADATTIRSFV